MFWTCPRLTNFWSGVFKTLEQAFDTPITASPLTALFGRSLPHVPSASLKGVIAFTTLLARRIILQKWNHASAPSYNRWLQEVLDCIKL